MNPKTLVSIVCSLLAAVSHTQGKLFYAAKSGYRMTLGSVAYITVTLICTDHDLIIYHTGALIGTLPTLQHRVSGQFHIIDSKTLFFEDFNYDGGGPGQSGITMIRVLLTH